MCAILRSPGKYWWRAYVPVLPVLRGSVRHSDGDAYGRVFEFVAIAVNADFGEPVSFLSAGN
jgi:hypothetical protein